MRFLLLILLGLSWVPARGQDPVAPPDRPTDGQVIPVEGGIRLPPGAAARAWSLVGPSTLPHPLPAEWLDHCGADPWSRPETFTLWAQLVTQARGDKAENLSARALLALLCARHQRPEGAWNHLARLSDDPRWVCAIVPRLFPGVPLDNKVQAGGQPGPLIRGTRLTPIAPRDPAIPIWALAPRKAQIQNLAIEESAIDLEIDISSGGIELVFTHRSGPSTSLACATPRVPGFVVNHEYLDFESQDPIGGVHFLVITPDDEDPRSLYSRLRQDQLMLPSAPGAQTPLSRSMRESGMVLLTAAEPTPRLIAAAKAFQSLLQVPVTLAPRDRSPSDGRKEVDLSDPTRVEAVLRFLCDAIERRLLFP